MLSRFVLGFVLLLGAYGCMSTGPQEPQFIGPQINCNDAEQRSFKSNLESQSGTVRRSLSAIAIDGRAVRSRGTARAIDRIYQLQNQLNLFDARVDNQYRAVGDSCKVLDRCYRDAREYAGDSCARADARWRNEVKKFYNLRGEIDGIEAEVDRAVALVNRAGRHDNSRRRAAEPLNRDEPCECNSSVGGVFSNGCC